jgi:hypothetical protein
MECQNEVSFSVQHLNKLTTGEYARTEDCWDMGSFPLVSERTDMGIGIVVEDIDVDRTKLG